VTTVVAPPEAIRRYFAGVNGEDWEDFRGIWREDAAVDVVGGIRLRGIDEIMEYYPRVLGNFPVHFDDPVAVHVAGDVVTVEIDFEGETVEGVPASFRATDVFRLEDGRVRSLAVWYDLGEVLAFQRIPGTPERRLARVLEAAGLTSLDAASPMRVAPRPERTRVVLAGGGEVDAADWAERVRLWQRALEIAGDDGKTVALPSPDPSFAEAAGKAGRRFAVSPQDADLTLEVLTFPATGPVAIGCGRGEGLHVLADGHVIELEDGELLVTPLRRSVPLVRFAPGIRASWVEGTCPCGSELRRLRVET
jgi:hypothetical protein